MKKYIFPVLAVALLTGCGKVSDATGDDNHISIVSGTVEGTSKEVSTSDTEAETTSGTTATKVAGSKISGTTTAASTKKGAKSAVTRASGGSGGVYGTTREVPVAPRQNKTTTTVAPTQPATHAPSFDPKECSSITYSFSSNSPNKIDVSRQYSDGKERSYQVISADTTEIQKAMEQDPSKSINDFIVKNDYDFDNYPDIFIIERPDDTNKTGKYYHYDPENGTYQPWAELNGIRFELERNAAEGILGTTETKDDIEYEQKIYKWNAQKQLVMVKYTHQYQAGDRVLIDYVNYDDNGTEILRETRDSSGSLIGGNSEEQPQDE